LVNGKHKTNASEVAIVGGETLLGRELQDVLQARASGITIRTFASNAEGNFGEQEHEAVFVEPLEPPAVRDALAILVAGTHEGALKALRVAQTNGGDSVVIDCTGELESQPEAHIVAPLLEYPSETLGGLLVIAHPAAMALALILTRLTRYRAMHRVIAHVFEPASERGKRGISELHQQTTGLLSFKSLDKDVFDAQLSFNLLSQYGEEAPGKLSDVELRIERNLAGLLSRRSGQEQLPMPSLRVIQAPVFHGYSISVWIEFAADIDAQEIREALASAQIEVRGANEEAPNNVAAATQSGLIAGDIRIDRNNGRSAWLWVVGDNLRLTADAAADVIAVLETQAA
jgi:aspartate-semialdehyde dehydrogenase